MSHFAYSSIKKDKNKLGVWLRESSNDNLIKSIKKIGRVRINESINRIIIKQTKNPPTPNHVFIEVWLHKLTFDKIFRIVFRTPPVITRYTVFGLWVKEDKNWICEGDLGTGLKE